MLYSVLSRRREDMEAERDELTDDDPLSDAEDPVGSRCVGTWDKAHKPRCFWTDEAVSGQP